MKKIVFCLALIVSAALLFAGNSNQNTNNRGANQVNRNTLPNNGYESKGNILTGEQKKGGPSRPYKSLDTAKPTQKKSLSNEYAYYAEVTKRNGWWEGIGNPLPKSGNKYLSCYYKLSKKNSAGHWTLMEAYDGYDRLTTYHGMGTYLLNQNDDTDEGANQEWKKKLQTVCRWQFIGDESDQEVIEERGMDALGNIVFRYHPVKVGPRKYTGTYTDAWGMPIFLRTDENGNPAGYANFVHATRDARGYEVKFEYTDQQGRPQKNSDGAYMTIKDYDGQGRQIMEQSCNIVGDPMTDNWGNCGWKYIFQKGNYRDYYYFDRHGNHMRMPLTERHTSDHVFGYRMYSDQYGRDTLQLYIDSLGQPDVNENGVQKIRTEYDAHGNWTYKGFYGSDGKLIAYDSLGIAQIRYTFDTRGHVLRAEYRDKDGNYVNNANDYCLYESEYEGSKQIKEVQYVCLTDGAIKRTFEFTADKQGNQIRRWYFRGFMRLDSVDQKGRDISRRYFDMDMQPINNPDGGDDEAWSVHIIQYNDKNNTVTKYWYDKDGDPYEPNNHKSSVCSKNETTLNPKTHINTYKAYIFQYMKYAYQQQTDEQGTVLAQWDLTPYGEHARVGWWDNLHYTCKVDYTIYGQIRTMVGRNEFDEPAYLTGIGSDDPVYYYQDLTNSFDENGEQIEDMDAFKASLPIAYCIEVTDTAVAYPLGLRNGDIIISYGNWTTSEDLRTNSDYFYLETILCAKHPKKVTLLRHHPESKSSEIITLDLRKGRPSDLGFYAHRIYYTQREKQRLLNTCQAYGISLAANDVPETDYTLLMAVQTKGGLYNTMLYHVYDIKDPGIVLYAMEEWSGGIDTWSLTDSINKWEEQRMFRISGSNLYYTQDMETYQYFNKRQSGHKGMRFIPIHVDEVTYARLANILQANREDIIGEKEDIEAEEQAGLPVEKKHIYGKWHAKGEDRNGSYILDIQFGKKTAKATVNLLIETENEDSVKFEIIMTITTTGLTWDLQDNQVVFNTDKIKNTGTLDYFHIDSDDPAVLSEWQEKAEILKQQLLTDGPDALNFLETTNNPWTIIRISPDEIKVKEVDDPLVRVK